VGQALESLLLAQIANPVSGKEADRRRQTWKCRGAKNHRAAEEQGACRARADERSEMVRSTIRKRRFFFLDNLLSRNPMSGRSTDQAVPEGRGDMRRFWRTLTPYVGKILHIKANQALSVQ
jgi:hypothetical protein